MSREDLSEDIVIPDTLKDNKLFAELFTIERGFWQATGTLEAATFIREHFAKRGLLASPSFAGFWALITRDQYIALSDRSLPWISSKYRNIEFVQISETSAMLYYFMVAASQQVVDYKSVVRSVYQKFPDNKWRLIELHQSLPYSEGTSYEHLVEMLKDL